MQAFISIKGLFEANSRVAIQANLRKLSWGFCFLLLTQISKAQIVNQTTSVTQIQYSETGDIVKSVKSIIQPKVANRFISGRTANIASPTVTITTDNTRIPEGQVAIITASLSAASPSDITVNLAPSGTATNYSDHQFSLRGL